MHNMLALLERFAATFSNHGIFSLGLLLITGYIFGKLAERIRFPAITGYILAGILVGEFGLGLIHGESSELLRIVSEITLSFIALIIGGEFSFTKLKLYGAKVILISLAEMLLAFGFVTTGLLLLGFPAYVCFLLGAISAATAPAATVVIVKKLKARGPFVDYLYGIVAMDDAGAVILFSLVFAFSSASITGKEVRLMQSVLQAFREIGLSLALGGAAGLLIHLITIKKRNINEIKIISIGLIFLATSLAISLHVSPLIANMTIGMLLINLNTKNVRIITSLEPLTPMLYALFFAIAGTELDPSIFGDLGLVLAGAVFISMRALGKYTGVFTLAALLKTPRDVKNYLGLSLFPQAGVAIGLVLFIQASPILEVAPGPVQDFLVKTVNIVLMSVFFNELTGPLIARYAIQKSMKSMKGKA